MDAIVLKELLNVNAKENASVKFANVELLSYVNVKLMKKKNHVNVIHVNVENNSLITLFIYLIIKI